MNTLYYSKYIKYKTKYIKLKNDFIKIGGTNNKKNIYNPIFIESFDIYDVLYNDRNQIVIISPAEHEPLKIKYIGSNNYSTNSTDSTNSSDLTNSSDSSNLNNSDNFKKFNLEVCPHAHTYIYYCSVNNYESEIFLEINGKKIKTKVNKYPEFKNEIIMSTMVRNEDDYILQWINYHLKLGIQRFIIYDNKKSTTVLGTKRQTLKEISDLENLLRYYINEGIVILIDWPYEKRLPISGISGQTTQQNHSIYAFNTCKYIGLFDIDEYVNPQTEEVNINKIFDNIIKKKKLDVKTIGSFMIKCKIFYNPNDLPTDEYNFFKIYICDKITLNGLEKNFVIPQNVKTFSVHMITSGKKPFTVNFNIMYFNHYYFLNKKDRGKHKTKYTDKTIKRILDTIKLF